MQQQQEEEIKRILACEAKKADPFTILGLDIETCEFPEIAKRYRKIVVLIHPDKCKLPRSGDAFKIVEKAYRTVPDEGILQRLKIAHTRKKEREMKLAQDKQQQQTSQATNNGANLSKEERLERMRAAAREESTLEATRRAEEAARKKARLEKKAADDAILSAALEKQIQEERNLHLF